MELTLAPYISAWCGCWRGRPERFGHGHTIETPMNPVVEERRPGPCVRISAAGADDPVSRFQRPKGFHRIFSRFN